jgi:hypothetical protein
LFKERKTKLTLLSLLSALVVISTASMGMIYAQEADDSELTTFEEEALRDGEETTAGTSDDTDTSAYLSGRAVSDDDNTTDTAETEIADIRSLFDGLIVCDLGVLEATAPDETEIAASSNLTTPTVSVTVMSETEVAEVVANETATAEAAANETSTAADETEVASAQCMSLGGDDDNATSTSSTADDMGNATSDAGDNATSTDGNATSMNATGTSSANATSSSNVTSTAEDEQIAVIEGQDFAPGEIVLVFSSNAIVAIDDVNDGGDIDAKVPLDSVGNSFMFVESGTTRTAEFNFDGETLIAAAGEGDIQAEGTNDELDIAEILRSGTNAAEVEGEDADEPGDVDATDDTETSGSDDLY